MSVHWETTKEMSNEARENDLLVLSRLSRTSEVSRPQVHVDVTASHCPGASPLSPLTRLQKIQAAIQQCNDRKLIRILNLAYWAEFFRLMNKEREAA